MNENEIDPKDLPLAELISAFPNANLFAGTLAIYSSMLADLPTDQLSAAVRSLISTSKFFPSVAEIRQAVNDLVEPHIPDAVIAWEEVRAWLPRIMNGDCVLTPKLTNPIAQKVANAIGWRRLYFYQSYCEKLFISAYNSAVDNRKELLLMPPDVRAFKEKQELKLLASSVEMELENIES